MPIFILSTVERGYSSPSYFIVREDDEPLARKCFGEAHDDYMVVSVDRLPEDNGVLHAIHFITRR